MSDIFDNINSLLRVGKRAAALSRLLDKEQGRIKRPYNTDLNHAWYIVGVIFYKRDDFLTALSAFKKSYKHWSKDIAAIRAIGNCYSEMGKPKTAKYYFIKAIKIGGRKYKDIDLLTYNLGNAYFDMKKYDMAITNYRNVRKADQKTYKLAQKNIKHAQKKIDKSKKV